VKAHAIATLWKSADGRVRVAAAIPLGILAKRLPVARVKEVLREHGRASQREREMPAHVVVYYVIALALYREVSTREVLRYLQEGAKWLLEPATSLKVTGKSGISQARSRLGWQPLKTLHDEVVRPLAKAETKGAWYRGWRLVTLDGSTLAVRDTQVNRAAFGKPAASRGESGFPQVRFVSLVENGTHALFGTALGAYGEGESSLAKAVVPQLGKGMLCLADRNFFGFALWQQARKTGADLLWRVKKNLRLPVEQRLADGSYLSTLYATERDRRHRSHGVAVRVIEYELLEVLGAEPSYRLITTLLDPEQSPAHELASLYPQRWEIETAFDELKTHLRGGAQMVLRSKTPDLVRQEFWGFLLAHFAVRGIMHEAALSAGEDPDRLSFTHTVRVIRRKLPQFAAFPPSALAGAS